MTVRVPLRASLEVYALSWGKATLRRHAHKERQTMDDQKRVEGQSIAGVSYHGYNIANLVFKSCNFIGAEYRNCSFKHVVFTKCMLDATVFIDCTFTDVFFSGCSIVTGLFSESHMTNVNIIGCTIKETMFEGKIATNDNGTVWRNVDIRQTTIEGTSFSDASFVRASFVRPKLQDTTFEDIVFSACSFEDIVARRGAVYGCSYANCQFKETRWFYVDLDDITIRHDCTIRGFNIMSSYTASKLNLSIPSDIMNRITFISMKDKGQHPNDTYHPQGYTTQQPLPLPTKTTTSCYATRITTQGV